MSITELLPQSKAYCPKKEVLVRDVKLPQPAKHQELVMMIGAPGSGKSSFIRNHFMPVNPEKIKVVSLDVEKTVAKTIKKVDEYLNSGYSVVVDNTNPDDKARERYVTIANKYQVPVRYLYMEVSIELARHLNYYREALGGEHVPNLVYSIYQKRLKLPDKYETIPLVLIFDNEQKRQLFYQRSE